MTDAPPSRNKAADGTFQGLVDIFRSKLGQNTEDMLPAKVIAYDRDTNRAQVQPLIVVVNTVNEQVPRAQIASVPVLQIGGGGFVISVPIKTGDLGWIKASDRDISLFKKNYVQSPPNTQRTHNFADGLFIPDSFMKDVVISGEDTDNLVIQNLDNSVRIAWFNDKIKITAPTIEMVADNIDMTASEQITMTSPEITMTASTSVTLDTPLTTLTGAIQGGTNPAYDKTATFNGNVTTTETITADVDVVADGISLKSHTHGGVQTGGGSTGVPQ